MGTNRSVYEAIRGKTLNNHITGLFSEQLSSSSETVAMKKCYVSVLISVVKLSFN